MPDETIDTATSQPSAPDHSKAISASVKSLGQFVSEHGGPSSVHLEYISFDRTRIVIVGEDGRWGDQVLPSYDAAKKVAEQCGFEVEPEGEWSREAVGSVKTTAYEWGRMGAGRAAGQ